MKTQEYKNRYGDVFTFTEDDDHNILWEGNFEYCRIGMPNDYTKAYKVYLEDREGVDEEKLLGLEEFKRDVHIYEGGIHLYPEYVRMVESLKDEIDMVDPSGGPYISRGMPLSFIGLGEVKVKDFQWFEGGYKIITEKCPKCNQVGGAHKMSCETTKQTILL